MGLDYHFHLQHFNGRVWTTPPEFDDATDRVMHGELMWFDDKDVTVLRLFIRDDALFPLHREVPPGFVITELYRMANRTADMSDADVLNHMRSMFNAKYRGWIGFDELRIDLWSQTELLVQRSVPSEAAPAFGDGDQRFPRQALLNLGLPENAIADLENTSHYAYDKQFDPNGFSLVDVPINRTFRDRSGPSDTALVTWKLTIAEFIGDWRIEPLQRARTLATDEFLRIICTFS